MASLLAWLFTCSILLFTTRTFEVSGPCLHSQQSFLLQLKSSLDFDPSSSTKLVNWSKSSDCCSWEGVFCQDGHVIHLNLRNEGIFGGLDNASILFNLTHLKSLDLSFNIINSPIPSRIANLSNLHYLNLSDSGFVGQIPIAISRLGSLVTLDLSNFFQGSYPLKLENPDLSMLVQNLSTLEELYLDGVPVSLRGNEWGPALSLSLPNLRVLSLSNCNLSGPFDQSLAKLHSLSVIRLQMNNLFSEVPRFFANFSRLTSLSLWNCELNGTFPQEIFQVPSLQTLDLSQNILLQGSLPEFNGNNSLQSLSISFTSFSGTLPGSMAKLTQLVYLDLSSSYFTGPIPSFNMSNSLNQIDLSNNGLTGEIPLANFEGLLDVVMIDLGNNFLSGAIPMSLFAIPRLEYLHLENNQFSGCNLGFQLSSSSLMTLDLSKNNLEGPFPTSIFQLRNLSVLLLSQNKFNGTVQTDMFQALGRLQTLDLSYNKWFVNASGDDSTLMSSFPSVSNLGLASCKLMAFPNLRNLSFLTDLDLSDNQLHGEIPNWIWEGPQVVNLSSNHLVGMQEPCSLPHSLVAVIDLHLNHLNGRIPALPPLAQYIDFSHNNFTSSIPIDILGGLSSLYFFSMANNKLTGNIPESICLASGLKALDLSNNNLSGRIPPCMSAMSQTLQILNLQENNFEGPIHDAFSTNCKLRTLDLSGNSVEGGFPESLTNCSALEVLDLGNNKMIDKFPCSLTKITSLRVLILRSNKFHRVIRCPITNVTWPVLQIFDLACNNFSGKLPVKLLTKFQAMVAYHEDYNRSKVIRKSADVVGFRLQQNLNAYRLVKTDTETYYQDVATVTYKGQVRELQKILTIFTYIDLSCNNFYGAIPGEVGLLRELYVLNLSNNALTDAIPPSIGNLLKLESLDLSSNDLSGIIPPSLANLNFLSVLNLSFNHLVGRVPKGNQLQTFSADSFMGNKGLCGLPLTEKCPNEVITENFHSDSQKNIDWNLLSAELGFIFGCGFVIGPLLFCKRWRKWYYDRADDIIFRIFPSAVSRKWYSWTA